MADESGGDRNDTKTNPANPLQSATGWVVGLAGLIAALSLLATNSERLIATFFPSMQSDHPHPAASQPPAATTDPTAFSNGETVIRGTWSFDLDSGVILQSPADADLFWEQETDIKRSLNPQNGAMLALLGQRDFDSLTLQTLKGLNYAAEPLRADNDLSNAIPSGTVVAYKTRRGRYGKMLIENYGYDLKVKWLTFGP